MFAKCLFDHYLCQCYSVNISLMTMAVKELFYIFSVGHRAWLMYETGKNIDIRINILCT